MPQPTPASGSGATVPHNKGMKLTSVERIGRSQLIPGVRWTMPMNARTARLLGLAAMLTPANAWAR
jgi:hypothetical protein